MLLITGPPASGKTSCCLDRVREYLRAGGRNWRLLVPTATMAEHLRNQLAREGYVFAPGAVSTFVKFVDGLLPGAPAASDVALEIATAELLGSACPERYLPVRNFAGFRRSLASAIDEFTSAGGTLAELPPQAADFAAVLSGVTQVLRERGLYLQADRLRMLNFEESTQRFLFVGFYSFNNPEIDLIRRLACQADVTVALSEWSGSESALKPLRTFATEERCLGAKPPVPKRTVVSAPTLDGELTEIARRLLDEHASGRPWRDIGIIIRSEEPYVPALRSALDRFGIPVRFYFGTPLNDHPVIRFFKGIVEAMLARWDHAIALEALRLTGSPLEHDDRFDFAVREQLPGLGLEKLRELAGEGHESFFAALDKSDWVQAPPAPVEEWQQRYRSLTSVFHAAVIRDRIPHEDAVLLRSHAAALAAWEEAVDGATAALASGNVSCQQFWAALRTVLESASLRVPDHRRDVVHVIDAFEARQWRLPVVFVCGLVEKHFPKYQSENPILDDSVRRKLQQAGIPLRTSVERQSDEQFLFDLTLSRATESLVLTYPVLNAKADANLPSFFILRAQPYEVAEAVDVRPAPLRPRVPEPHPGVFDDHLRSKLAERHTIIPASAIESYLQCPYQFFSEHTLKLAEPPADPWVRLDPPRQGSIAHKVLERVYREKRKVREIFDSVFKEACAKHRIPSGYRTEAIRLDLRHNLELLVGDDRLVPAARSLFEQDFDLALDGGVIVSGRIDRVEIDSAGRGTVIDYKYSGKLSIGRTKAGHDEGTRVQGGLYLLALARLGGYTPAGMVYCGFKREVSFGGWIIRPHYVQVKAHCTESDLHKVMIAAKETALNAIASIRDGIIKPSPADETRCQFCAFSAICRVEKLPVPAVAESVMA